MNIGKVFEEEIRKSIPSDCFYYRFRDNPTSFNQAGLRFSTNNICDCMVFKTPMLYLLELKSHKGNSLPLSCIRPNQIQGLLKADSYKNVVCLFLINFRDKEETYAVDIKDLDSFIVSTERKSVPISYVREKGILVPQVKKRTRYTYDMSFIGGLENERYRND